ncbi:MAG: plastocyanin/azurin family copper-binding protein [Gemmatimonadales bacterium]
MRTLRLFLVPALVSLAACGGTTSPSGGGAAPGQVSVGNNFFRSTINGSEDPAVDTVAVGDTVTWVWSAAGSHSIQSTGLTPEVFRNSVVMSAAGNRYSVAFRHPGSYSYDCGVHGPVMSGRIVVLP